VTTQKSDWSATRGAALNGQARAQFAQAQAEANGNLARARADAEGNLLKAKADAEGLSLRGEGDAAATRARIEAAGGTDNYIRQIDAQSKLRWKWPGAAIHARGRRQRPGDADHPAAADADPGNAGRAGAGTSGAIMAYGNPSRAVRVFLD
jgi:hypothetical protein